MGSVIYISHPSLHKHYIILYYIIITPSSTHHARKEAGGKVGGEKQCVGKLQQDVQQEGRLREEGSDHDMKGESSGPVSAVYPQGEEDEKKLVSRRESETVHYQQGQQLDNKMVEAEARGRPQNGVVHLTWVSRQKGANCGRGRAE